MRLAGKLALDTGGNKIDYSNNPRSQPQQHNAIVVAAKSRKSYFDRRHPGCE